MRWGRASWLGAIVLLLVSASALGATRFAPGGGSVTRPDGTVEWNTGLLLMDGNSVSIYVGGAFVARTVFDGGLSGATVEAQYTNAFNAILAYRGPTQQELREAAGRCGEETVAHTPWAVQLTRSIFFGESSTTTTRDTSGSVANVSTNETPLALVKSICIQYGVNCWCHPCTCQKFLTVIVTILTPQGPCVFNATMHVHDAVPCS